LHLRPLSVLEIPFRAFLGQIFWITTITIDQRFVRQYKCIRPKQSHVWIRVHPVTDGTFWSTTATANWNIPFQIKNQTPTICLGVTLSETRPQELTLNFHQLPVHIRRNSNQVLELLFSIHQEAIQQILCLDKPTIRQDLDNRKTSDRHQVSDHRQLLSEFQIKRTPPACSENRLLLSPPPAMHHPLSVSTHRRLPIPSAKMKPKNPFLNPCSGPQLRNFNPLSVQEYSDKQTLRILLPTRSKNLRRLQLDSTQNNRVAIGTTAGPVPLKL
jgi:hypothetical protein